LRRVAGPGANELQRLVEQIAARVGQVLERCVLIERDIDNAWLAGDFEAGPLDDLIGHSITYRIAVGPRTDANGATRAACEPPALPGKACRRPARARPGARSTNQPGLEGGLNFLSAEPRFSGLAGSTFASEHAGQAAGQRYRGVQRLRGEAMSERPSQRPGPAP